MTEAIETRSHRFGGGDSSLREEVGARLDQGRRDSAIQAARLLLDEQPGQRSLRFLRRMAESDAGLASGLKQYRVGLLSSYSIEFAHDALLAHGFINGLRLHLYQPGFGTFRQELLDGRSELYKWSPDVVVLAVEGEDWSPATYRGDTPITEPEATRLVDNFRSELSALIGAFRTHSTVPMLVHNFALPAWRRLGVLDAASTDGQAHLVNRLNDALRATTESFSGVHIVDYAALTNRHGTHHWYDARMRLYARAPIAQVMLGELAREYAKFFRCLVGYTKKCLVLDLDNTLWGGVVGEDGIEGIQLGPTYPGNAFVEFQLAVLALHRRGVVLAIASKNNPGDVEEVFTRHQFMALHREHFADLQIHWEPKSESLRRIAANLALGLEHIVFVDDNPAECEQVRSALPMVTVIQLPPQPERYIEALHVDGWFDVLALSSEDQRRGELYRQRSQSEALRSSSSTVEDYYRGLEMELSIAPIDNGSLRRAAQLTQKTNQLNVTTRRYTELQLSTLRADPGWISMTVGLTDRFGDNGIIGVMLATVGSQALDIDTFLLSCRVIGRGVETAMLAELCDIADQRRLPALTGQLIPTTKNLPVRDLFERHGFAKLAEDAVSGSFWRLDLPQQRVRWPEWFRVVPGRE